MALFPNASPQVIMLGADDKSIRSVAPSLDAEPLHFPLVPIFARKGTTDKVATDNVESIYGSETVEPRGKYYTHQTRFLVEMIGNANTCMIKRLIPKDAGPRANCTIYLDVIAADVPNYVRTSQGDLVVVPETNTYKVDEKQPTIPGYFIKFIKEYTNTSDNDLGMLRSKTGTMTFTKDYTMLNKALRLTHYAYLLQPDSVYEKIGTNKADYISQTMTVNVERWKSYSYEKLQTVINDAIIIIKQYQSEADNAPKSSYELTAEATKSTMYPILEVKAKYQGEYYNNIGFSINSLYGDEMDQTIVGANKALPFGLSLYTRTDSSSSPTNFRSLYSETSVNFCFKEDAINPNTEANIDLETIFENNWFNETDSLKTIRYKEYEGMYFYKDNYELVMKLLLESEKQYVTNESSTWYDNITGSTISWYDFTTADQNDIMEEIYVLNPFSCRSSKNVKYRSIQFGTMASDRTEFQREVTMSSETPIFLEGGSDGTMNKDSYEELVVEYLQEYNNPDSEVQDMSYNLETILYDSGFSLDAKKEFANFIKLRKDTAVVLSTHDAALGEKFGALSDQRAIGVALRTKLKLAPESSFYGTGVCRGMIVVGCGKLQDGTSKDYVPLTFEIASKASKMMGASNGRWNMTYLFDNAYNEGNVIKKLINIQPDFIPAGIKPTLWNDGLAWAQRFDRVRYHFPALQTVYDNDTSVLNSFFNMMALLCCERCGYVTWKTFTGTTNLTSAQFIDKLEAFMSNYLKGRFGTMITTVPQVVIEEEDELLGYSWKSYVNMYGNNMKTVGVHTTRVYRSSDLTTEN